MRQKVMNRIRYVQITIFIEAILESLYKVLLGPYILLAPTLPVFFFNGGWVLINFWHFDCYNLYFENNIFWEKNAKLYFLEASHWSLKQVKNHIHRVTHCGETAVYKIENFGLFSAFHFKNKKSWHFQFFISQIFW